VLSCTLGNIAYRVGNKQLYFDSEMNGLLVMMMQINFSKSYRDNYKMPGKGDRISDQSVKCENEDILQSLVLLQKMTIFQSGLKWNQVQNGITG